MRKEVHLAALRAASKVAFSMAFVAGCSAADADDAATNGGEESEVKASAAKACEDTVNAAFPVESNYPGKKTKISAKASACCTQLLESSGGMMRAHRWDCCASAGPDFSLNKPAPDAGFNQKLAMACTPWGPPVPPAMKAAKRRELAAVEVA